MTRPLTTRPLMRPEAPRPRMASTDDGADDVPHGCECRPPIPQPQLARSSDAAARVRLTPRGAPSAQSRGSSRRACRRASSQAERRRRSAPSMNALKAAERRDGVGPAQAGRPFPCARRGAPSAFFWSQRGVFVLRQALQDDPRANRRRAPPPPLRRRSCAARSRFTRT